MKLSNMILTATLMVSATAFAADNNTAPAPADVAKKVRYELVTLPFYGVFDNLWFELADGTVTLHGHVTRPTLRTSAERVAQRVPGVAGVINKIEVLPLSSFDDSIRLRALRAVYGQSALNKYAIGANPPIRIIVKNGELTLEGVVLNDGDRDIANIQANGVFGVFKVNNNLRVENPRPKKA
jgi:hyperosmotically inducible protein